MTTTLALLLGWAMAHLLQPGVGLALPAATAPLATPTSLREVVLNAVPTSIVDAMARGDVLQIVVFCLLFAMAALAVGEAARPVVAFAEGVAAITLRLTHHVMLMAPFAAGAALAGTAASSGAATLAGLGVRARGVAR